MTIKKVDYNLLVRVIMFILSLPTFSFEIE